MSMEIMEKLRREGEGLFRAHPVVLAYLYGSQAKGGGTPLSDVDVAVVTDEELLPRERLRLELALETALSNAVGGDFDVRVINDAPLSVKGIVVQTGTLLYARDEAVRVEFEARVRDFYFDFLPVLDFHRQSYLHTQRTLLQERGLLC